MAIIKDATPPYRTDPLQNIINVQWDFPIFSFAFTGGNDYQSIFPTPLVNLGPIATIVGIRWVNSVNGDPANEGDRNAVSEPVYGPGSGAIAADALDAATAGMFPNGGQFFTTFGSWHTEVFSNGPGVSISPSSGSQGAWQYRSSLQGGPGYSPMSNIHPLSGGPLLDDDGNPIRIWTTNSPPFSDFNPEFMSVINTLFLAITGSTVFLGGGPVLTVTAPSILDPGGPDAYNTSFPDGSVYARLVAPEPANLGLGSPVDIGGGGVTVSPAPFQAFGKTWKALGLVANPYTKASNHQIYCKRVDPDDL